ncbi:ribosome small subunit-dependent GTPase A [Ureaplasma zalophigenitalium]|uniref:Small ribosomal subunit biogenesis GTPase RsgA n=1 Tax=Ureaplasma zalophigenitalium TaxID=907723 RepID=A0ABT3BP40_9BACT|nr:ribosome small subunit-dependent GTPase A [Ureaplasma zalophigenitalium]MCV3754000.1 ribosome small subunit-dependent GTPase A [Ureaplasma zalophigenitalium]
MRAKITQLVKSSFQIYIYEKKLLTNALIKGIFKYENKKHKPLVGDEVEVEEQDNQFVITTFYPRTNTLIRPRIANVDIVVIVAAFVSPFVSLYQLNKLIAYYESQKVNQVVLAFSKYDLLTDHTEADEIMDKYKKDKYTVVNLQKTDDVDYLHTLIKDHVFCLVGQSGVGKSTLINKLLNEEQQKTQEVSLSLQRGKNTTTATKLIRFKDAFIVDTPGYSSFDLSIFTPQELAGSFKDFALLSLACKFHDCLHLSEPECAVKEAVTNKEIQEFRYSHYLLMLKEIKNT